MRNGTFTLLILMLFIGKVVFPQDSSISPTFIGTGVFHGETPPLRDIPPMSDEEYQQAVAKAQKKLLNPKLRYRNYPFADQALPKGVDAVWQKEMGTTSIPKAPIVNFSGQTSPYFPSDCNGTAGPNHYMQTINVVYAIYNKTGTLLAGPTNMNTLFSGVTGATYNDGDPLILYDEQAQRWLAVEFSISGSNDYMLIAVSTTSDPTGTWYKYSFDVAETPDYEKFGIWQDGYYMGVNNSSGNDIYVFQRSVMLSGGQSPLMVGFDNAWRPSTIDGFMCVPPLDNDGPAAPAGSPGIFITINDDAIGGGSDQLWIYELTANWSVPSSSVFTRVQQINVSPFDSNFGNTWSNIVQPGTTQKIDAIPMVIMNAPQYRNFGTYQTIVCCHTVDVDATDHAGIRWYELRRGTQTSGNWSIRQQGTYSPDANSRWLGSIMLNGSGQLGLGYSISSSTVYPGIRYSGQSSSAYNSASGILDIPEDIIQTATTSQSGTNRWGDYSLMSVDPSDDKTFWFTTQYGGSRQSKIASFKFGNAPGVATLPATSVTLNTATLNGTVNPSGLATTYYFQWGTSTNYEFTTTTTSAGSGTSTINVSGDIINLIAGQTYHFRLVATNSDGTTYGNDLTFSPGQAVVSTTPASSITNISAISGGNVISDGGSPVTQRGVCWSISANPTISGDHTTDGSGLGEFASTITGLSASATYHIRAYAINGAGTFYGSDLTFSTSCGIISTFPWSEGFENGGTIPNCWTQEQVNSSGLNWTFITGNGGTAPATAHTGTYNACLKDNSTADNKTRLISPTIDLSSVINPTLTFWHTQAQGSTSLRQDQLYVYYKTSSTGTWTLLASYTNSITSWTQRTISLPNGSSDYYINFEGNAKRGQGVCIDDVSITISNPTLVVTPPNIDVSSIAGNANYNVTSNTSWSIASDQSWCTVTPSGTGNGTITAVYGQNNSLEPRIANITATTSNVDPLIVTLTQLGTPAELSVTPSNFDVDYLAGNRYFSVSSNTSWDVSCAEDWCTVTPSGSGNGTINTFFQTNTSIESRTAEIYITANGLQPLMVTLVQAGQPCISPTAFAGFDNAICNTDVYHISDALALNYSTLHWTTSGDGTFSNPDIQNPVYFPGLTDQGNDVALLLTVEPLNPCALPVTDTVLLTVQLPPVVDAGEDLSIFSYIDAQLNATASNYRELFWETSGDGIFDDPLVLNPVYSPGPSDIATGSVTLMINVFALAPCSQDVFDEIVITIIPCQLIEIPQGWSGFSSFVVPLSSDLADIFASVADTLQIVQSFGDVYWPQFGINTIGEFNSQKGYYIKLSAPVTLSVTGNFNPDKAVDLMGGWNLLPVISNQPLPVDEISNQLGSNLVIITEIAGGLIYWPNAGIFSLTSLVPGKAYLIQVTNPCTFMFPD